MAKIILFFFFSPFCLFCAENYEKYDGSVSDNWKNWSCSPISTKNGCSLKLLIPNKKDGYCYFYTVRGDYYDRNYQPFFNNIVIDDISFSSDMLNFLNGPINKRYLFRLKIDLKSDSPTFFLR